MKIETKDGRVFKFEGETPHRRANGSLTVLRLWSSSCVKCGDLFVVKTPSTTSKLEHSRSFGAKHCQEHKLTKGEVEARWLDGIAKSKLMGRK